MQQQQPASANDVNKFSRLQLEVDALLDLPDEDNNDGATEPEDEYFTLGRDCMRFYFTGAFLSVREYMRPLVSTYADPGLNLADCIDGLERILAELRVLDADELTKTADGVFRARRRTRQESSASTTKTGTAANRDGAPLPRLLAIHTTPEEPCASGQPGHPQDCQFLSRLHMSSSAIEQLRLKDVGKDSLNTHVSESQKVRLLARAWAVYYVTGMGHALGGTYGPAMASVADQSISQDQCIKGLDRVRDRLDGFDPGQRRAAFALIDDAYERYVPELEFTPA